MKIYVTDYPTVEAALDAAVDGDQIYFPGIKVYEAPENGWRITKSLEIYGDGPGSASSLGTVLEPNASGTGDVFGLVPDDHTELDNVSIRDLRIVGPGGTGSGVGIKFAGTANRKLGGLRIERVSIVGMGGAGISLAGHPFESGHSVGALIAECAVEGCGAQGIVLHQAFQNCIVATRLAGNGLEGIRATESQVILYVCSFDGSEQSGGMPLSFSACAALPAWTRAGSRGSEV